MSEIDAPSHTPLQAADGAKRVTPAATTSDDSSAQQQSTQKRPAAPENTEIKEKTTRYDTAVILSTNLSNLEIGSQISANYLGVDGQERPLIVSETGTYVVKYDKAYQQDVDKLPPNASLDIKILEIDRDIEARLTFKNPAPSRTETVTLSIPVTLELIGLGNAPPRLRPQTQLEQLPLEQQKNFYQATDLYQAENIARESAQKLSELPLPTTNTNYTLYERAIPQQGKPTINRPRVAGNALIAQEQIIGQPPTKADTPIPATENIQKQSPEITNIRGEPIETQVEKLLHTNILATVIKNIPKVAMDLPKIVQKYFGPTGPLDNLKAGHNFSLRIESIAVPHIRPNTDQHLQPEKKTSAINPNNVTFSDPTPKMDGLSDKTPADAPPRQDFSGIIIAPGQHILSNKNNSDPVIFRTSHPYPDPYSARPSIKPLGDNEFKTLYVATPVSVIKFQSPLELIPGTVINFTLVEPSSDVKPTTPINTQKNESTNQLNFVQSGVATSISHPLSQVTPLPDITLQPLEHFLQNWQSISQILSVMVAMDGNIMQGLQNRLPNVQNPAQMTSSIIFFLAALGASHPARVWLGPHITERLETLGQGKLLKMLDIDMQRLFRLGTETHPHEWRPSLIPLQVGQDVNAIPILTRQIQDDNADKKKNSEDGDDEKMPNTRFLVELDLSQFGQIQVDGLLKTKKLNIIIRSKIILPSDMKHKMTSIFTSALEANDYAGDLQFKDNIPPEISVRNIITQKMHMTRS
ncbi:MAG: hypothetical protein K9G26_09075 [Emcibacter sp.]|nr:hypothetical protein [Emcibacter sp.]